MQPLNSLTILQNNEDAQNLPSPLSLSGRCISQSLSIETSISCTNLDNELKSPIITPKMSNNNFTGPHRQDDGIGSSAHTSAHNSPQSPDRSNPKRNRYHPISLALGVLEGLGTLVENIVQYACGKSDDNFSDYEEEEEDDEYYYKKQREKHENEKFVKDVTKFDRHNSFDTFGTMNTMSSFNSVETNVTSGTGNGSIRSCVVADSNCSFKNQNGQTVDDDGNIIPEEFIKDHIIRKQVADILNESSSSEMMKVGIDQNMRNNTKIMAATAIQSHQVKKKKKKRRRKRVVGFEYPPISTMRQVPRVNSEERKKLFFTDSDLYHDSDEESCSSSDKTDQNEHSENRTDKNSIFIHKIDKPSALKSTLKTSKFGGSGDKHMKLPPKGIHPLTELHVRNI